MNPIGASWLGGGLAGLVSGGGVDMRQHTAWFITASGSNLGQDQEWRYSTNLSLRPSPGDLSTSFCPPCQKFISMSSRTGWAGSCGFNVISRVTQPSLCGVPVIWLNSNWEKRWFFHSALASYPLRTHKHMVKSLELGQRALWNPNFQANWIQTLWRQRAQPKTLFLNDSWNNHNRLMFIPSHIKREKESTYSRFLLTSRQWEELSGNDSLMKSSRSLGWLVWVGAGGVGETPSACCLTCSFWRRRSFLKSLAFRHGGRLGSAPIPAPQRKEKELSKLSKNTILNLVQQSIFKALPGDNMEQKEAVTRNNSITPCWTWIIMFAFMLPSEEDLKQKLERC